MRALVGGRDFYDESDPIAQFNLATQGRRQPGSAFKPFVLAAALDGGQSLTSVYGGGAEVEVATDSGPWVVQNYNQLAYPDLTLLEATVFSVNVVFARLVQVTGPAAVIDLASASGVSAPLQPLHSVALGAQEVSPLDMAAGFATFAAEGLHVERHLVSRIDTAGGVNLYEAIPVVTQVIERDVANDVTAALSPRSSPEEPANRRILAALSPARRAHLRSIETPGSLATHPNSRRRCGLGTRREASRWNHR